jgi:hypothetical protein
VPLLNLLDYGIGSTHLCHHINPRIPCYNSWQATALLQLRFPDLVHHDPTPIHLALGRVACLCAVVRQDATGDGFFFSLSQRLKLSHERSRSPGRKVFRKARIKHRSRVFDSRASRWSSTTLVSNSTLTGA